MSLKERESDRPEGTRRFFEIILIIFTRAPPRDLFNDNNKFKRPSPVRLLRVERVSRIQANRYDVGEAI